MHLEEAGQTAREGGQPSPKVHSKIHQKSAAAADDPNVEASHPLQQQGRLQPPSNAVFLQRLSPSSPSPHPSSSSSSSSPKMQTASTKRGQQQPCHVLSS